MRGRSPVTRALQSARMTVLLMIVNAQDVFAPGLLALPSRLRCGKWLDKCSFLAVAVTDAAHENTKAIRGPMVIGWLRA